MFIPTTPPAAGHSCSASPSMLFERMHSLVAARLSLEAWTLHWTGVFRQTETLQASAITQKDSMCFIFLVQFFIWAKGWFFVWFFSLSLGLAAFWNQNGDEISNLDHICNMLDRGLLAENSQHLGSGICTILVAVASRLHGICYMLKNETCSHCYL